ncbi:carboxypeptidase D isoform X3 [Hermetia illucens]|uniref:carboxypeptidase D isoform X3 n=1 Tax=Hermetia illucens TaxID=343691 RepID=UPI0018CC4501|nr:carboxypeptidase D isoform X3 [Hermetia illucens]
MKSPLAVLWLTVLVAILAWSPSRTTVTGKTIVKEDESFIENAHYHTHGEIEDLFARLQKDFPMHAKVHLVGKSREGRSLIALQISRDVRQRNLLTPMFKYVGNMHGDESVGRELLVQLALYLLFNYDRVPEVTGLVNTTDIYLMPTMNPDGFARSEEGRCESLPSYVGRSNAAGIDLNRDFPDRLDNKVETQLKIRQPETLAIMQWVVNNPFVLSANFHGGAVVASYPFDNSIYHHECCEDSPTPDDKVFRHLARTYAQHHPIMKDGRDCNETFADGIVNGAYWYELSGGMQDFNYVFSNCFELTLELSCCKFPPASELPNEWRKNKRSMLEYLKQTHIGVKGLVQDVNGYPIRGAEVLVQGLEQKPIRTTERGEYWRLLEPGTYNVQVIAFGFNPSEVKQVTVVGSEPTRLDFSLRPVSSNNDGISPYPNTFFFTLIK